MTTGFFGYPGQVWGITYITIQYFYNQIASNSNNPVALTSIAETTYSTLMNAIEAIDTFQASTAAGAETQNYTSIAALPLSLDPTTQQFFTYRFNAMENLSSSLSALVPVLKPLQTITNLQQGISAIPSAGLLPFYMTWAGETAPSGLTPSTFYTDAVLATNAWQNLAGAIQTLQGNNLTQDYDTANRMYAAQLNALLQAVGFADSSGGYNFYGTLSINQIWITNICLFAILQDFNILAAPQTSLNQQCGVIKYIITQIAISVARFLLSLRRYANGNPQLIEVRQNDTIFDLAARATGNLENWRALVAVNSLTPPYIGPGTSAPVGTQLVVPNGSTTTAAPPNYALNILGADFDFGAPGDDYSDQGVMPPWNGDFQLIVGISNYQRALGRRILTALQSYIYDETYGSRLPPLIGTPLDEEDTKLMAAYAQSALASDPRTGAVNNCTATTSGLTGTTTIVATVTPIGLSNSPVEVNQTLLPLQ